MKRDATVGWQRRAVAAFAAGLVGVLGASVFAPRASADAAPVNAATPVLAGVAGQGETLTASSGSWTGTTPIVFAYTWERCDSSGGGCITIAGANGQTYGVALADVGHTIRVVATATNAAGSAQATSSATGVVGALSAPTAVALPQLSGTASFGQTLTASTGTWSGTPAPTLTYQWQRCDSTGAACSNIPLATAQRYTLVASDVGGRVQVVVTAANAGGTSSHASSPTSVVTGPPVSVSPPTVSGSLLVGQTLSVTTGSWGGAPVPTFAYQWKRCDAQGNGCAAIPGATSANYAAAAADASHRLTAAVTATNPVGSGSVTSAPTSAIAPLVLPANTAHPTISGVHAVGRSLTANPGIWRGTPPISFSYVWQRCNYDGAACLTVAGATSQTYALVAADFNHRLQVVVSAANSVGHSSSSSGQTSTIQGGPILTEQPTLLGTIRLGQTIYLSTGGWLGSDPITFTYRWQRCNTTGTACQDIPGATNQSYQPGLADIGSTLRGVITATNPLGVVSQLTSASAPVPANPQAPRFSESPGLTGRGVVGDVLHVDGASILGTPPATLAYQWQRCTQTSDRCADIPAARGPAYRIRTGDTSSVLRAVVTATNTMGASTTRSLPTEPVTGRGMTLLTIGQSTQHLDPNRTIVRLALLALRGLRGVSVWLALDVQRTSGWHRIALLRVTSGPGPAPKIVAFDVRATTATARISIRWRNATGRINKTVYIADTTTLRPETPAPPAT